MKFTLKRWSVKRKIVATLSFALLFLYIICLPRTLFKLPYSTVVTDRNGELLGARIAADGQWRFPHTNTTPSKVETCLLAFEDRHFYHHWGVNPLSTLRAAYQNLKARRIVSGGSTLTMQTIRLARNAPRTFTEKIIEMIWATRLEFRYSKKKILSLYLAHAPFGGNVVGLQAAAWRYFGHSPEELSWAEAAMLAVLPNAPATIHLGKGRKALWEKRNKLLTYLYQEKRFDHSTYELAISEPLPGEPHPLSQTAPYLVNHFYLEQPGKSYHSTINKGLQIQLEELADRWSTEFGRSDIRHLALLVIDVPRNEVVAYCGNVHYNRPQTGNQVDVIQAPRSTGSILKPFLYYAMLDEGALLPHTLLADIPININGFNPQNFSLQFEGAVPASEAIARSLNIPSVLMLQRYGVPKLHRFLQEIGLTTINRPSSHYGLSLILGGAEATLFEVTQAYANMGRALQALPQLPARLVATDTEADTQQQPTNPFHKGAVWQTFEAIKEVNRPEEIDWKSIPSMQTIAWKTGTSYGFRDAWAVGVTARYAVGVWVGNATGEGKPGLVGARTAGPVLFDVFNLLPRSQWFTRPANTFIEAEVCKQSGHLKGRFCEETDTMLILPAGLKTEACPYHHAVTLSADERYRIYENCANTEPIIQRTWFSLPPVWEWYYKQHHPEYQSLPPFKKGCGEDPFAPMQFIYPSMNARLKLPKQLDGSSGGITVELAHSQSHATVYWHLDQTYLTQTEDFHKLTITPQKGKHTLTAVDDSGNTISTTFLVE